MSRVFIAILLLFIDISPTHLKGLSEQNVCKSSPLNFQLQNSLFLQYLHIVSSNLSVVSSHTSWANELCCLPHGGAEGSNLTLTCLTCANTADRTTKIC